ncbi:hypothetical protein MRF4_17015 [Methylobacterium radiotolerans]|uniref:hypothetical protein n=1 Tax=Methylobacterium TaxID=407 RepID=UPI002F347D62
MPDDLAPPGVALALVLLCVVAAGTAGVLKVRRDLNRCAGLIFVVLVLTLTMAASVVVFRPLRAGDLIDERREP